MSNPISNAFPPLGPRKRAATAPLPPDTAATAEPAPSRPTPPRDAAALAGGGQASGMALPTAPGTRDTATFDAAYLFTKEALASLEKLEQRRKHDVETAERIEARATHRATMLPTGQGTTSEAASLGATEGSAPSTPGGGGTPSAGTPSV